MLLWSHWWLVVSQLRSACPRRRTFFWLVVVLAALCTRRDLAGVTSFVRALGLRAGCYGCVLDFFHSSALCPDNLARLWTRLVLKLHPGVERCGGRLVILADGLKKSKCGKKMPAVKLLFQSGESNTKPEYVMGHSCQALALLAKVGPFFQAIPLCARIHEGLVFSNRDQRTLLDKLILLLDSLQLSEPVLLIADAYYATGKIIFGLFAKDGHLLSRLKKNACAFEPVFACAGQRGRGRPRRYGRKVKLRDLFAQALQTMASPAYGECGVTLTWTSRDLLWRPAGCLVRIVAVVHPTRGQILLLSTDLSLSAAEIIRLYALRFKIELSFKNALHTVGAWSYHFWMMPMRPIKRGQGDQFLHRQSEKYRASVRRKLAAYHRHIQVGLVAQGILQCLAALQPRLVWSHFASWLRTRRSPGCPTEFVVATALRHSLPDFLSAGPIDPNWRKFLGDRLDLDQFEGARLAA
jgi:Transposase DDE domain